MKADGLFVITAIVFIFVAWVATGGPTRPISSAGLFITPVTRPGEESQGYRLLAPPNPIDTSSYPKQVGGASPSPSPSTENLWYTRGDEASGGVYLDHSIVGPANGNPNDEYVAVVNSSNDDVTISDWRLKGTAFKQYVTIPKRGVTPLTLHPGEKLTLITGRSPIGPNQEPNFSYTGSGWRVFLNRNLELWAPTHETITLSDPSGRVMDSFSY